jgi:crotonobetainyl-CoA:carnitine CoA-transferase CaiB-like acyl-CoA transferase
VGAQIGALGILAALHHRSITGEGQYVDVSQCEVLVALCPEAILDYFMNGRTPGRAANRDDSMAPHGVYRSKGENNWVSIAVSTKEEWEALCETMGKPDLTGDPRFADSLARYHNQEELDTIVSAWSVRHTDYEAMHLLQEKGIPASAVLSNSQMVRDTHLRERGFSVEDDHPETGKRIMAGFSWHLSRTPTRGIRHAPLMGEHNKEIFCGLLGMTEDEVSDLENRKIIY